MLVPWPWGVVLVCCARAVGCSSSSLSGLGCVGLGFRLCLGAWGSVGWAGLPWGVGDGLGRDGTRADNLSCECLRTRFSLIFVLSLLTASNKCYYTLCIQTMSTVLRRFTRLPRQSTQVGKRPQPISRPSAAAGRAVQQPAWIRVRVGTATLVAAGRVQTLLGFHP